VGHEADEKDEAGRVSRRFLILPVTVSVSLSRSQFCALSALLFLLPFSAAFFFARHLWIRGDDEILPGMNQRKSTAPRPSVHEYGLVFMSNRD